MSDAKRGSGWIDGIPVPETAILTGAVVAYLYLDDEGDECWGYAVTGDETIVKTIGLLEATKSSFAAEAIACLVTKRDDQ